MSFDIDQTLNGMVTAVAGVMAGEWPNIQDYIKKAIMDEVCALTILSRLEDVSKDELC